jgi:YcxB-like protein
MELTYRLTSDDHQRGTQLTVARVMQHARQVSGWGARPVVVISAAGLLGLAPLAYLLVAKLISPLGYFVALCAYMWGALSMWLCAWSTRRLFMSNWLPDDSPSLSEVRLKLDAGGVETSDRGRSSKYAWQVFNEVSESGDLVILWFDRAQALLVPGRAFPNEEMRKTFVDTVRGYLTAASAQSAARCEV